MARAGSNPTLQPFSTQTYIESWAASNLFYADYINETNAKARMSTGKDSQGPVRDYVTGNINTQAAARSGVVNSGGYNARYDPASKYANTRATPNYAAKDAGLDIFGNKKRQKNDAALSMRAVEKTYGLPGAATVPSRSRGGKFIPNTLSVFLMKRGSGGVSPSMLRGRNTGTSIGQMSTRGWKSQLSQSEGPQKGQGGVGQSSIDSTNEMYMTKETARGHNMYDTDEKLNENKEFGRDWAGWNNLPLHEDRPNYLTGLGNMYKEGTQPSGYSKRKLSRAFYL